MTIINKIPAPLTDNYITQWHSLSLPDNHIRLTISFEYHLLDLAKGEHNTPHHANDSQKKYYITYTIAGNIEGKTDILTPGEAIWTITHDVHVNAELLMNLYQKPSEFIIWEVSSILKDIKRKVIIKNKIQEANNSKDTAQSTGDSGKKQEKKNLKMSLANTGLTNKLQIQMKKKTIGTTIQKGNASTSRSMKSPKTDTNIDLLEAYLQGGATLPRTSSFDEKKFSTEAASSKKRPGSASPVLSRRSSALSSAGRVSPHPHHYNHPEKHIDPALIKSGMIQSRSSSFSNLMDAVRPKTPPSPHHHVHPQKILQSAKVDKKKQDARQMEKQDKRKTSKHDVRPSAKVDKKVNSGQSDGLSKKKSIKEHLPIVDECDSRITWSSTPPSGKTKSNWEKIFQSSTSQKNNDFPVEKLQDNILIERKKGENIHVQIEKTKVDLGMLFFDQLEIIKRQ